jgi:hypothetical protein
VTDVVEVDRLGRVGPGHAFHGDVEHAGDRDRAAHPALRDGDGLRLDASKAADERAEGGHRSPALTAGDRAQGLALRRRRPLVHDDAHGPVARDHWPRRVQQDGKAQIVEHGVPVAAAVDVEDETGVAEALGGRRGQARRGARADEVAAAGLEVLAVDLPLSIRHDHPPLAGR